MHIDFKQFIELELQKIHKNLKSFKWMSIDGGSINETYKVSTSTQNYFVKLNTKTVFENGFKEEVAGLQFLNENSALVPQVILEGTFNNSVFLVLEWIDSGRETPVFWENFGKQLAKLHQHTYHQFGLNYPNFMGQLPQNNTFFDDFVSFFVENRLKPQVALAYHNNLLTKQHVKHFENLYKQLPAIFPKEQPSAVHGDLWSGNFMCNTLQKAILIDPAVYYGHREVDLAMSTLFGGFSNQFYETYNEVFPLEKGFEKRKNYYNLYPLLIHLNLFGSSYLKSITSIISYF